MKSSVSQTPLSGRDSGRQLLTGYGEGGFKINHERVEGSVILLPDQRIEWPVNDAASITLELLKPLLDTPIELLLIGTGRSMVMIDANIRAAFKAKGIATDIMDTGAACRTYNVLLAEDRRVAAALIAV
jgi:uncharacterized protein